MTRNVVILYCGSSFTKSLFDTLLTFKLRPVLLPSDTPYAVIEALDPLAIMISGSPDYVNGPFAPTVDLNIYDSDTPVLGICYGMQRMAKDLGGTVKRLPGPEKELTPLKFTDEPSVLFRDFTEDGAPVWMAHVCIVTEVPEEFSIVASTAVTAIAAMEDEERQLYAVQFHPEHKGKDPSSQAGTAIIWNFLNGVCGYEIA